MHVHSVRSDEACTESHIGALDRQSTPQGRRLLDKQPSHLRVDSVTADATMAQKASPVLQHHPHMPATLHIQGIATHSSPSPVNLFNISQLCAPDDGTLLLLFPES